MSSIGRVSGRDNMRDRSNREIGRGVTLLVASDGRLVDCGIQMLGYSERDQAGELAGECSQLLRHDTLLVDKRSQMINHGLMLDIGRNVLLTVPPCLVDMTSKCDNCVHPSWPPHCASIR